MKIFVDCLSLIFFFTRRGYSILSEMYFYVSLANEYLLATNVEANRPAHLESLNRLEKAKSPAEISYIINCIISQHHCGMSCLQTKHGVEHPSGKPTVNC